MKMLVGFLAGVISGFLLAVYANELREDLNVVTNVATAPEAPADQRRRSASRPRGA